MPGMLTPEDMSQLEGSVALEFDRLFLQFMISHHRGALTMVEELLDQRGTAQDSQLFAFTADITADQTMEIDRMDDLLADLSSDPRVHLSAGFLDAGEAAWNLELVSSRPKPEGFYDPKVPAGRPIRTGRTEDEAAEETEQPDGDEAGHDDGEHETEDDAPLDDNTGDPDEEDVEQPWRPGILNFANTDMAFGGSVLYEGNYHGFNAYSVENPESPQLLASVVCPGGQGDISVIGNLLVMSVEQTRGRLDCGLQGVAESVSDERFRGVRIFDIRDLRLPQQVAAVQTCRGSHTHTLVTDPDDTGSFYIYGSGTSTVRPGEELEGCSDESPTENPDTALFRIDVIHVPMDRPQDARIVNRPFIFSDPDSGAIAGLWAGGDHGPGTQTTRQTTQCHDITAYPDIGLAAGACAGNGILLDISDPTRPIRLDQVTDPGFAYWHSATFNNDGTKVIFTDEWGGGGRPRCRASDPREWGANAIFDVVDREMKFRSYYKLPVPQTETENCVAHNGSLVPIPGRDIMVQAWYQGGISVMDFTDSSNPIEIAYFDRGPLNADDVVMAGYWSAYWYRGFIYGTEIARGLDVLRLVPSEYVTANEVAAASLVAPATFNAQQQRRIDWPAHPAIARAYLDQLRQTGTIDDEQTSMWIELVDGIITTRPDDTADVAERLDEMVSTLRDQSARAAGRNLTRLQALADTVDDLAESIR